MKNRITIKDARILANLTEDEACAAMKITKDRLQAWETGSVIPSWENAIAMSETYGIPLDVISFSRDNNEPQYDSYFLREMILEKFESYEAFCSVIHMNPKVLRSRLNGTTNFRRSEIVMIRHILKLSEREIELCFFTEKTSHLIPVFKLIRTLDNDEIDILKLILNARDRKPAALAQI